MGKKQHGGSRPNAGAKRGEPSGKSTLPVRLWKDIAHFAQDHQPEIREWKEGRSVLVPREELSN